ncbi:MAG TPA: hypothetical protein VNT03_04275 [Baekduia sp.]|nr:hypothetical protein [Baekduia sp.]
MAPDREQLDELRARLRAAQEAAETVAGRIPSQGWATAPEHERSTTAAEIQALVGVLHALRDLVPADVWDQVRELVRQLLMLLRALLDVAVERLGADDGDRTGPRRTGPNLQDIPIA